MVISHRVLIRNHPKINISAYQMPDEHLNILNNYNFIEKVKEV